jgi:hypothetical protein
VFGIISIESIVLAIMAVFSVIGFSEFYYRDRINSILKREGYKTFWWGSDYSFGKQEKEFHKYLTSLERENPDKHSEHMKYLRKAIFLRSIMLWLFFIVFLGVTVFMLNEESL